MSDQDRIIASGLKSLPQVPLHRPVPTDDGRPAWSMDETEDTWSRLLPFGGGVIQHIRQTSTRDSPDEVLGEHLMTQGEHRIAFTMLRGTGTGMRVGVATEDGSRTWGYRVSDGRLSQHPPPAGAGLLPRLSSDGIVWNRLPGSLKVEVVVNLEARTLEFNTGVPSIDTIIQLPEEGGMRFWFESILKDDAIAISEYRFIAARDIPSRRRSPSPRRRPMASNRDGGNGTLVPKQFAKDLEEWTKKKQEIREARAPSPGPGAYEARTSVGGGVSFTFGRPPKPKDSREAAEDAKARSASPRRSPAVAARPRSAARGPTRAWVANMTERAADGSLRSPVCGEVIPLRRRSLSAKYTECIRPGQSVTERHQVGGPRAMSANSKVSGEPSPVKDLDEALSAVELLRQENTLLRDGSREAKSATPPPLRSVEVTGAASFDSPAEPTALATAQNAAESPPAVCDIAADTSPMINLPDGADDGAQSGSARPQADSVDSGATSQGRRAEHPLEPHHHQSDEDNAVEVA